MNLKEILGPKALSDVRKGLYALNEIQPLIDLAEKMGLDMGEEVMRAEHLKRQLQALHDAVSGTEAVQ